MAESPRLLWKRFQKYLCGGDRWLALVAGMWIMACAGSSYTFAIYSPVLKSTLGYSQVQIEALAVAKDAGESVGLLAGAMCDLLPPWAMLLVGALHNLVGFGSLWLVLRGNTAPLPFWQMCALLAVGSQGASYLNTANLVTGVRNFPKSRGPIVGVLKGLVGLSGALFTQAYSALLAPDQKDFVALVAIAPLLVTLPTMFLVRPVGGRDRKESEEEEGCLLSLVIALCFLLAAYLLTAMLAQDLLPVARQVSLAMAAGMVAIFLLPLAAPLRSRHVARRKRQVAASVEAEPLSRSPVDDSPSAPLLGRPTPQGEPRASDRASSEPLAGAEAAQARGQADTAGDGGREQQGGGEAGGEPPSGEAQAGGGALAGAGSENGQGTLPLNQGPSSTNQESAASAPTPPLGQRAPKPPLPPSARTTVMSTTPSRRSSPPSAVNPNPNPSPNPSPSPNLKANPRFTPGPPSSGPSPHLSRSPAMDPMLPSPTPMLSSGYSSDDFLSGEEDERGKPAPLSGRLDSRLRRQQLLLLQAVGEGAVRPKRAKGPRRGEDFTLSQALVKADFWLLFFAVVCGCGSGLAAINNLAQMGLAQGYANVRIFVSMVSVWNFCGRIGAGFLSEHLVKAYALPRPCVLLCAQASMAVGHLLFALALPGSLYLGSLIVGLGYGAHWAIMPATASELFGLKHFGMLYNALTIANPLGSFLFSGLVAAYLYDMEAARDGSGGGVTGGRHQGVGTGMGRGVTDQGRMEDRSWRLGRGFGRIREGLSGQSTTHPLGGGTSRQLAPGLDGTRRPNGPLWFLGATGEADAGGPVGLGEGGAEPPGALGAYRGRALLGFLPTQSTAAAAPAIVRSAQGADCYGAHCFQLTFFIMMGVSVVGVVLNAILIHRTKPVYYSLYGKQIEAKRRRASSENTAATDAASIQDVAAR